MRALRRLWAQLRKAALRARLGQRWTEGDGFSARRYPDYETYLAHQRLKVDALRAHSLSGHDQRFHAALSERLAASAVPLAGRSVLCLAARTGAEVRAFIDQGAFAVGIDLNPGRENRWVVVGDFHALQYADRSVDVAYTNSIDHVYELERMVGEVARVLKPGGTLMLEVGGGTEVGAGRGFYEALSWSRAEEVVDRVAQVGFTIEHRAEFTGPWPGLHVVLKLVKA